jgi:hypothetical protein
MPGQIRRAVENYRYERADTGEGHGAGPADAIAALQAAEMT